MKKIQLYNETVDILVDAYFKNTLVHGSCTACAVGNIIASRLGHKIREVYNGIDWIDEKHTLRNAEWPLVFMTCDGVQSVYPIAYKDIAKKEIDCTGYTWEELAKVEKAFECAPLGNSDDEWMFNGLMAVIDVLDEIHENTDKGVTTVKKQRFVKELA